MGAVEQIAAAVLYEGYILWPYRRSATKNQQRWTIGGVYPRTFSDQGANSDPWFTRTECLVAGDAPSIEITLRFLQVVDRQVCRRRDDGTLEPVDELTVDDQRYLTWDEAAERQLLMPHLNLTTLNTPRRVALAFPDGREEEPLTAADGTVAGALVRSWQALEGTVEIGAEPVSDGHFKLTVTVENTTPWPGGTRDQALRRTLVSAHTILWVQGGEFVSLTDPPDDLAALTATCHNVKTWPVLAGDEGERATMLSSPIILADYPQIAPESPGDLFDGSEIDQLLVLNILTLTDDEKSEMRASDPRAREILDRSESLTQDDFMRLHGAIRDVRVLRDQPDQQMLFEELERPAPDHVDVRGVTVTKGSRVLLHPRPGGDIMDIALAGKVAIIEQIDQDYEDRVHLAVTIEDDPGRDLGADRVLGHRFYFSIDEVEPIDGESS